MNKPPFIEEETWLTLFVYQLCHPKIYKTFQRGVWKERENNPTAKHPQVPTAERPERDNKGCKNLTTYICTPTHPVCTSISKVGSLNGFLKMWQK